MELKLADDFELVKAKYMDVAQNTPEIEKYARWVYGKHPTEEYERIIWSQNLYAENTGWIDFLFYEKSLV